MATNIMMEGNMNTTTINNQQYEGFERLDHDLHDPRIEDSISRYGTLTIEIPETFWDDHMSRECTPAIDEKSKGRKVVVTLDHEGWQDLLSDCWYYLDFASEGAEYLGLVTSAGWTLSALARTEIPQPWLDKEIETGHIKNARRYVGELPRSKAPKVWAQWTGR